MGGRFFLALVSITFIVSGLMMTGEWICFLLLTLGFIAAVLFAFHSRLQQVKIFDKLEMALIPGELREEREPERPTVSDPGDTRPPSLEEIRAAARNPTTRRRRS